MKILKKTTIFMLSLLLLALTACGGSELPSGMDADELMAAGQKVALLLVEGEYEAVYELLREDQRALTTVEQIEQAVRSQLDGAGVYKQIEKRMTSGTTIEGERYGAVMLYCEFSEEDVLVRLFFDPQLQLVGFSLKQD